VNHSTDFDEVGLHGVENQMRLKAEASIASGQVVNRLSDKRKVCQKPERAD